MFGVLHRSMLRATQVPMQEFICDLRFRHLKVRREADFSCPRAVNKKAVTYHKWCGSQCFFFGDV